MPDVLVGCIFSGCTTHQCPHYDYPIHKAGKKNHFPCTGKNSVNKECSDLETWILSALFLSSQLIPSQLTNKRKQFNLDLQTK